MSSDDNYVSLYSNTKPTNKSPPFTYTKFQKYTKFEYTQHITLGFPLKSHNILHSKNYVTQRNNNTTLSTCSQKIIFVLVTSANSN